MMQLLSYWASEVRTQKGGKVDLQDGAAVAKRISRWGTLEDYNGR